MDFSRKLSLIVFLLCVLISLKNQEPETNRKASSSEADYPPSDLPSILIATKWKLLEIENDRQGMNESLRYDYYNESCPFVEEIVRSKVRELYELRPNVAPALLRLVFHDCFVEGCDASVLLDAADGIDSEKDAPPNESLQGFDLIDIVKLEVEETCPGVVSCADIIALAARESVLLDGGPFYPLYTGRRDSTTSYPEIAIKELPSPQDNVSHTIELFASRGFDEREIVSLLGAHSTGTIHCKFFFDRLYNFNGSIGPDPSIDAEFLDFLRSICNGSHSSAAPSVSPSLSPSSSPVSAEKSSLITTFQEPGLEMDHEVPGTGFGMRYYRSLLQGKGLLFVDQQLTAAEATASWVQAYASDTFLFRRDFGITMIKLSSHQVLTAPMGQVRLNCRKIN